MTEKGDVNMPKKNIVWVKSVVCDFLSTLSFPLVELVTKHYNMPATFPKEMTYLKYMFLFSTSTRLAYNVGRKK